jgi:DNA-binding NtrC family response regulator
MSVLVIEKDADMLFFLNRILTFSGFEVLASEGGQKGLEVLKENKNVNYIISNSRLSDMNEIEFAIQAASIQGKPSVTLISVKQFFDLWMESPKSLEELQT